MASSEKQRGVVVVGYDGSEHAADALALARLIAAATGDNLLLAAVVPHEFPYTPGTEHREEAMRTEAAEMLADAVASDGSVETQVVAARTAAQGLHDLADSLNADALVVGSSHHGVIGRVLAGSVALGLLHVAPCPVAVAPVGLAARADARLRVVACAVDGSPESLLAMRHAESLARAEGAALRLLAVHEPELVFGADVVSAGYDLKEVTADARRWFEQILEVAAASIGPGIDVQRHVLEGSPVNALASAAENGIDLLVVGSRQYGPVRRVLLGSVSSGLVRSCPTSLLVVPRAGGDRRQPAPGHSVIPTDAAV